MKEVEIAVLTTVPYSVAVAVGLQTDIIMKGGEQRRGGGERARRGVPTVNGVQGLGGRWGEMTGGNEEHNPCLQKA